MSHSQKWPLSQSAHKSSGECSVCHAVRQLHNNNGTVHRHGPRHNPCPGSDKPPATVRPYIPVVTYQQTATSAAAASQHNDILSSTPTVAVDQLSADEFTHPTLTRRTIKHIPKSARPACAKRYAELLRQCTNQPNSLKAWTDLLNFGRDVLIQPSRGGRRHNLASVIKKRTVEPANLDHDMVTHTAVKKPDAATLLANAVSAKIEDGNLRAAIRIMCSEDKPAPSSDNVYAQLLDKHPAPSSERSPMPDPQPTAAVQMTEADVLRAVRSFPAGSAGGPDGVRPQHILEMVNCREIGPELHPALAGFVNCLLQGEIHPQVSPVLFGGNLIALEKKSGGIRPIAVGYTLRRIAAKCANSYATSQLTDYFNPIQMGVGVPGGCEAAVHATRRYIDAMPHGHVVAKIDFSNAFNSLRRDLLLRSVASTVPGIYRFCHLAYSQPSVLRFDTRTILSQEGPHQGDPLGALLFCVSIHPELQRLQSELVAGFMDDVTLGGPAETVAADIDHIRDIQEATGLRINASKCEIISHESIPMATQFEGFISLRPDEAELLGAPLLKGKKMDEILANRCSELDTALGRLSLLAAHDALILLKASFSAPKMLHTLRCSPCGNHPSLAVFDDLLRKGICAISNLDLSDPQWLQASLPVKDGGLGVRRVTSLAPSAFLASAAGTETLQLQLLRHSLAATTTDRAVDTVKNMWSSDHTCPRPEGVTAHKQSAWDKPVVTAERQELMMTLTSTVDQARMLAVSSPHSGDWLHALPLSGCGLRLDDKAIHIAVGLRLGANICEPHQCPCGASVDAKGLHGLSCKGGTGRSARHHALNDMLWHALSKADIPAVKEPSGLLRTDGKRPDGVTQLPWRSGKCVTWDVTVIDTLAASYVPATSQTPGAAAETAADRKTSKYATLSQSYLFVPVAVETMGAINRAGMNFLGDLGRRITQHTDDHRESAFLFQRISVLIQRFNSVAVLGTFAPTTPEEDV